MLVCAADWIGMSENDLPNALGVLQDLSKFPTLPDRLQQGFLNFLYIGRAMVHPKGFAASLAFWDPKGPLIDTRRLFYYGNSQGGIAGGALTAVAPGLQPLGALRGRDELQPAGGRAASTSTRSARCSTASYPDRLERPLLLSLIQTLWDRGEPNGYAWHMTRDPLPNTPRHKVLQILSFGDHQVANVATEVEARTIGSRLRLPAVDPGRHTDVDALLRHPADRPLPVRRATPRWWSGTSGRCAATSARRAPPISNTPPRLGVDPHDLVIESEPLGAPPDRRVPADRRAYDRRVRQRPMSRGRLGWPVGLAVGAALLAAAAPAQAGGYSRGRAGRRRPVLPERRQRRLRRRHYSLDLDYDQPANRLDGPARRSTRGRRRSLSRFNLDLRDFSRSRA